MNRNFLTLFAVGDVGPRRGDPHSMFHSVRSLLRNGDIVFGQMETNLSLRGTPAPQARLPMRADPAGAIAIRDSGFTVMSCAGNHALDWGTGALLDTLESLHDAGIETCGAGADLRQARRPAILTRAGIRVAFLAYSSVLPQGYWAQENRPGCAPVRASTIYEPEDYEQPGSPGRVHTFTPRGDLGAMLEDIEQVRSASDVVVVSMHWGVHFIPAVIADYQRDVAHAAIDAGADAIFGHHPHILKGIEFYKGRPVFYSLGNFAIEQPAAFMEQLAEDRGFREIRALNPDWDTNRPYMAPRDTRKTFIAACHISARGITGVSFLPCFINDTAEPVLLAPTDPRFMEVVEYVRDITADQGIPTEYLVQGDAVLCMDRETDSK